MTMNFDDDLYHWRKIVFLDLSLQWPILLVQTETLLFHTMTFHSKSNSMNESPIVSNKKDCLGSLNLFYSTRDDFFRMNIIPTSRTALKNRAAVITKSSSKPFLTAIPMNAQMKTAG